MKTIRFAVVEISTGEIVVQERTEFEALMVAVRMNYKYDYKRYGVVKTTTITTIEVEQVY